MARHEEIHYVTVGKLKELLNDPALNDNMLIFAGKVSGDLMVCRPGATKDQECCCWDCQIGEIDLADEEVRIRSDEE